MDFLNRALAQLRDLFQTMTPGARIVAGLLLAVVVTSLGYLFHQGTAGPDEFLFGGEYLPDSQLNRVEAAIAQANLSGHLREGNRIRVPAGQKAAYLAAVADADALPPNFNTLLETALDKGGPWESREATRERLKIAKQQTLSEIVRAMHWVEDAVVLYDEQDARGLSGTKQVTGSVNVRPSLGEMLDPRRTRTLQTLVAHAVVGLRPEDVAVTNLGEGGTYGADGNVYAEAFGDVYYQTRVAYEQYKRQSILNALRDIPGVRVEVNAELDDTVEETTLNVKPDPKPALRKELTKSETSSQTTSDGGGRPGTFAQGPNRQGANEEAENKKESKTSTDTTETENVVGEERRTLLRKGFTPKEVWATVTIPQSYVESIWKQRNPDAAQPPKEEDLRGVQDTIVTKVENVVEPLLPRLTKGEDTYKQVRVVVLDSVSAPPITPPSMATRALAWTGRSWSTLAMLGVAVFSLLVLRSVAKSAPTGDGAASVAAPTLALETVAPATGAEDDADAASRPRLRLKKGTSLKDDLADIVREDPDAAAAILKTWIGKAG